MTTIVIDRATLPESISSYFAAPRIAVSQPQAGGEVTLSPIIDPADYDNEVILRRIEKKPRDGWETAFIEMRNLGDDELIIPEQTEDSSLINQRK